MNVAYICVVAVGTVYEMRWSTRSVQLWPDEHVPAPLGQSQGGDDHRTSLEEVAGSVIGE